MIYGKLMARNMLLSLGRQAGFIARLSKLDLEQETQHLLAEKLQSDIYFYSELPYPISR
jgi:hypothetical protein